MPYIKRADSPYPMHPGNTEFSSYSCFSTSSCHYIPRPERNEKSTALASGLAGAILIMLLLGCRPGLIAGFFVAYVHDQPGAMGDISRALGEIALLTREKALLIDRKHRLVSRGKVALIEAWEYAKELDRQHNIIQKLKEYARCAWILILDFVRHKICVLDTGVSNASREPTS